MTTRVYGTHIAAMLVIACMAKADGEVGAGAPAVANDAEWSGLNYFEHVDDAHYSPLVSQCGIQVAYLALRAMGKDVSLAELSGPFRGRRQIEQYGLSVGELAELLRTNGLDVSVGRFDRKDEFDAFDHGRYLLVVMLDNGNAGGHYEIAVQAEGDRRLLSRFNRDFRWVEGDALWKALSGPVIVVPRSPQALAGTDGSVTIWPRTAMISGGSIVIVAASYCIVRLHRRHPSNRARSLRCHSEVCP